MKSFFDVLKTMFYRKNAKSYGTPDRSRKRAGDTTEGTDKKYRDQKGSPFVKKKTNSITGQRGQTVRWIREWIRKISY